MILCIVLRIGGTWVLCKVTGRRFYCFDKPIPSPVVLINPTREADSEDIERLNTKAPHAAAL